MKLAEALQERADLNTRIEQLRVRIQNNSLVQEGEKPSEDPKALAKELDACLERLEKLIAAINVTNCATKIDGVSLTELIAKKDVLKLRLSAYRDIIYSASQSTYRARGTEIKIVPVVKAAEYQKKADELSKELRIVDNLIQQTNWQAELIQ
ncbi:MAG: DIP1984 family protein [Firmicutes bacterium]|nr:DIP1984 family protein [Bacillota bacterium]